MAIEHLEVLTLLALPAVAGVVVGFLGPKRAAAIRWISLAAALAFLALALLIAGQFMALNAARQEALWTTHRDAPQPTFRPVFVPGSPGVKKDDSGQMIGVDPHATSWNMLPVGPGAVQFYVGVDGLNIWLVVLTAVLLLPAVLVSWRHIDERVNEFYAWLLILQTTIVGVFLSFDIILFYVFFEFSLVPLFFLIGIWGGAQRRHAAHKFLLYTLTGSLISLLGILGVVLACYTHNHQELTFSIPRMVEIVHMRLTDPDPSVRAHWAGVQWWVFLALTAGLAVKVPLVPFHTWLPLAHVEAPTAGSVDLAGVLLKVGAYGFLRLCVPLAPDASLALGLPLLSSLAVIGIIYGALCAYAQSDIKRLIAYSSVSHLGMCMLGMFALNIEGLSGSLMMMLNHGLSTAGLFLVIGMLYERYHTRQVSDYGGLATRLPFFGAAMVFLCLTSVGLPGLNGFVGELLVLMGVWRQQLDKGQFPIYGILAASGIILGAWYLFTMLRRVFFGPVKEPPHDGSVTDITLREWATLAPIAVLCLFIGVYPFPVLKTSEPDLVVVADIARQARLRQQSGVATAAERTPPVATAGAVKGAP